MRTATVFLSGITSTAFPNIKAQVTQSTKADMEELDEAIRLDREMNGKKPLKARKELNEQKEIKVSMTDPDCGYMVQNGKPEGPSTWIIGQSITSTTSSPTCTLRLETSMTPSRAGYRLLYRAYLQETS